MKCGVCGKEFPSWDDPTPPNHSIGIPVSGHYVSLKIKTNPEILCFDCFQKLKMKLAVWWCKNQWCDIRIDEKKFCVSALYGGQDGRDC